MKTTFIRLKKLGIAPLLLGALFLCSCATSPSASNINRGQLECLDEAFNTSIFLHLLANHGLLTWHTVDAPAQRGYFLGAWPHSIAVLVEKDGGGRYAIDSWFHDPGVTAEVVPLKVWKGGWKPAQTREAS